MQDVSARVTWARGGIDILSGSWEIRTDPLTCSFCFDYDCVLLRLRSCTPSLDKKNLLHLSHFSTPFLPPIFSPLSRIFYSAQPLDVSLYFSHPNTLSYLVQRSELSLLVRVACIPLTSISNPPISRNCITSSEIPILSSTKRFGGKGGNPNKRIVQRPQSLLSPLLISIYLIEPHSTPPPSKHP